MANKRTVHEYRGGGNLDGCELTDVVIEAWVELIDVGPGETIDGLRGWAGSAVGNVLTTGAYSLTLDNGLTGQVVVARVSHTIDGAHVSFVGSGEWPFEA